MCELVSIQVLNFWVGVDGIGVFHFDSRTNCAASAGLFINAHLVNIEPFFIYLHKHKSLSTLISFLGNMVPFYFFSFNHKLAHIY